MKTGIVLPHHEIGTDPGAIRAFVTGAEELGAAHIMIYDHVVGADRNRPGGFNGPYDKDVRFHEPFTFFAYVAALTSRIELVTGIVILPQRQTALVAKQAAELAILSENRLRLGIGTGWNKYHEKIKSKFMANITAIKADALPEARGVLELAKNSYQKGKFISADKISPVYLRDNVTKQQ